ncbi:MAG: arginase family protein, partial [Rhodothalassiaceae bacterium]
RAQEAGITIHTMADVRRDGLLPLVERELARLAQLAEAIYVDFDIDVIARNEAPGAPGARAGGITVADFFAAARRIAMHPKVRAVDLTEFDPSLDVSDMTALVAARWFAEILAGFATR